MLGEEVRASKVHGGVCGRM